MDLERARRAELRLAARLSSLFARQAALLTRRREAAAKRAERARKDREKAASRTPATPRGGGVLVVPREAPSEGGPERPWPDPEAVAAALARKHAPTEAQAEARAEPGPGGAPGYLLVPGTASPEDWNRRVREHDRRLKQGLRADRGAGGGA